MKCNEKKKKQQMTELGLKPKILTPSVAPLPSEEVLWFSSQWLLKWNAIYLEKKKTVTSSSHPQVMMHCHVHRVKVVGNERLVS